MPIKMLRPEAERDNWAVFSSCVTHIWASPPSLPQKKKSEFELENGSSRKVDVVIESRELTGQGLWPEIKVNIFIGN